MTISVIITVYNLERYVGLAIQSVLNQTRIPDEIIVVDDGSSDGSVKAIQSFGDKVRLIRMEQNSGVLVSFLAGLKSASGVILSFLDGDDVWLPEKLGKVEQVFNADDKTMMVTHLHEWIDQEGKKSNVIDDTHRNLQRIVNEAENASDLDRLLKNSILCYKGVWLGSAFCIRRQHLNISAYERWVTSLPGTALSHQDQPLAAYMIHDNPDKKIHLINEVLFQYRVYPTNSSGSSINVASALKTLNRSIATVLRTKDIVERHASWKEEKQSQQMKLKELEFYRDLYTKHRLPAVKKYFQLLINYWSSGKAVKETQRLAACLFFGPTRFLQSKTKKRFH